MVKSISLYLFISFVTFEQYKLVTKSLSSNPPIPSPSSKSCFIRGRYSSWFASISWSSFVITANTGIAINNEKEYFIACSRYMLLQQIIEQTFDTWEYGNRFLGNKDNLAVTTHYLVTD